MKPAPYWRADGQLASYNNGDSLDIVQFRQSPLLVQLDAAPTVG